MILETLLNQPASEPELFYGLTMAVRAGFHDLGRRAGYFIKIDHADNGAGTANATGDGMSTGNGESRSKFSYVVAFDCDEDYQKFKYSSEYHRCGVNIYNEVDHFEFIGFGFSYVLRAKVFIDRIEFQKVLKIQDPNYNFEKTKPVPRDLLEAAKREFGIYFANAKRRSGAA